MASTAQVSKAPKTTTTRARSSAPKPSREHMIAEAAYYRAEKRGFAGGDQMRDWLDAEAEINQTLIRKPRKPAANK
jgi:hypothetical protein